MSADPRRFRYQLEPVLRLRRWHLEALEARLGRIVSEIKDAEDALSVLRARYRDEADRSAQAESSGLHLASRPQRVLWLCRLRHEILSGEERLDQLRKDRAEVASLCLAQRHRVEVIERHREDRVTEFLRDEERRLASETDRDWLARRHSGRRSRPSAREERS